MIEILLERARRLRNRLEIARTNIRAGRLVDALRDLEGAIRDLDEALEMARKLPR